jgi:hypothetical protein
MKCVYDDETGVQEFLDWEKKRFEDLEKRVAHTIPVCKLPPWESVPALRLECIKRCQDQNDHECVKKMSSEAKLQRWLLTRCKRECINFYWLFIISNVIITVTVFDFLSCRRLYING